MVRTRRSHCVGPRFNYWSGKLRSHKPRGEAKKKRQGERQAPGVRVTSYCVFPKGES